MLKYRIIKYLWRLLIQHWNKLFSSWNDNYLPSSYITTINSTSKPNNNFFASQLSIVILVCSALAFNSAQSFVSAELGWLNSTQIDSMQCMPTWLKRERIIQTLSGSHASMHTHHSPWDLPHNTHTLYNHPKAKTK